MSDVVNEMHSLQERIVRFNNDGGTAGQRAALLSERDRLFAERDRLNAERSVDGPKILQSISPG